MFFTETVPSPPGEVAELAAYLIAHRGNAVVDEIRLHRAGKEPFQ